MRELLEGTVYSRKYDSQHHMTRQPTSHDQTVAVFIHKVGLIVAYHLTCISKDQLNFKRFFHYLYNNTLDGWMTMGVFMNNS